MVYKGEKKIEETNLVLLYFLWSRVNKPQDLVENISLAHYGKG